MQPNSYLSVAIPTYNREKELVECLNSIVPQAKRLGIRIYVSDNASTNDVGATIDHFRAEYPWIIYHRNEVNLGLDANVRKLVSMVESQYVWLFSDDDVMADGALELILPLCQSGRYDLIIPDREYRSQDFTQTIPGRSSINQVQFATEFDDPVQLLSQYCYCCFTFIGCLVVCSSSWRKVDESKYISYDWFAHVCVLAEMMLKGKALVLPDRLIYAREGNTTWSRQSAMVWAYHYPRALAALPSEYPNASRRKALINTALPSRLARLRGAYGPIMTGRAQGVITWRTRNAFIEAYLRIGARTWVVLIWLVVFVPTSIVACLRRLVRSRSMSFWNT